jgi:C-terminal processing protease CtpA/Prc
MAQDRPQNGEGNEKSQTAHVGLDITRRPPFVVLGVGDLMDCNRVLQGRQGYSNEPVAPGDRLLQVDHVPISNKTTIQMVHDLLNGQLGSCVELRFFREEEAQVFTITAVRHGSHQYDCAPPSTDAESADSQEKLVERESEQSCHADSELEEVNEDAQSDSWHVLPECIRTCK